MSDATTMKSRLRGDLMVAMKDGARSEAALLRGLIAALDNAEAAPVRVESASAVQHAFSAGTAEVPRLRLDAEAVRAILTLEIDEREEAAAEYRRLGQGERAGVLRAEAEIARRYVGK